MNIGLIDVDSKMPNLALMQISAYHKQKGDCVQWFSPLFSPFDLTYASKVFTFTPDYRYHPKGVIKGGTGYQNIEREHGYQICPDYDLYEMNYSLGFLTRGCSRNCSWCIVPKKEGDIRANSDINDFLRHDQAILMDNNVLAHDHGITQIEKIARLGIKVDFNQGLDARLINIGIAKRLAAVKWLRPIRLACDTQAAQKPVAKAVQLLRKAGATPRRYFCYLLVKDVNEAHDRSEFLRALGVDPFAQPYRDFHNKTKPTQEQKDFTRWVNHKAIWKTVKWEDYVYGLYQTRKQMRK